MRHYGSSIIPVLITSSLICMAFGIVVIVGASFVGSKIPSSELAYQSNTPKSWQIHLMDVDHDLTTNLTDDQRYDSMPRWSPDGSKIAYISSSGGKRDLYIVNSDGRGLQNLTNGEGSQDSPSWSPDGRQIVFSSNRDGDWDLFVVNLDDLTTQPLTENDEDDTQPNVSKDGKIVFTSTRTEQHQDVFTMWLDGTNVQQLTFDAEKDGSPNWSAQGDKIVWVTERAKVRDACTERHNLTARCIIHVHIYAMAADGSNPEQLTSQQGTYWSPIYSDDGEWITYAASLDDQPWSLYMRRVDGTEHIRLTDFERGENYPSWRPTRV